MPVTNYYTVEGEIIGEKTTGEERIDYLTDALGSVCATLDQTGQVVNTYRYKPYGGLLAKTGNGADPSFGWVGSLGYRQTAKKWSDVYVRARHNDTQTGRWTSKDPLWPAEPAYTYAGGSPSGVADPMGLWGAHCHYGNTRQWLERMGLCWLVAHVVADADRHVDDSGNPRHLCYFLRPDHRPGLRDKALKGAHRAAEQGNCVLAMQLLGQALHWEQDIVAHGECTVHWPWLDNPCATGGIGAFDEKCSRLDETAERTSALMRRALQDPVIRRCVATLCRFQGPPVPYPWEPYPPTAPPRPPLAERDPLIWSLPGITN